MPSAAPGAHVWLTDLIRREGPAILRMLWRFLGNEQDVMDAYQDCFCRLVARTEHRDLVSAKAYVYRTASNIAIEFLRVRKRRAAHWPRIVRNLGDAAIEEAGETCTSPITGLTQAPFHEGEASRLREAIGELPTHLQQVIVLRDLTGMTYEEVGKTLCIEPTTARVYRRHAVVRLAELLEGGGLPNERGDQGT